MIRDFERRYLPAEDLEVRGKSGEGATLIGHAAVFNRLSQNLGGFVEMVKPGAFRKTIQEADIRALVDHESRLILGRNRAGTLTLAEDDEGLLAEIDIPDTSYARDLVTSIERGDVTQMSFGFTTVRDDWKTTEQDFPLRLLEEVRLFDVSPVTFAAYTDTSLTVERALRSFSQKFERDVDETLSAAIAGNLRELMQAREDRDDDEPDTPPLVTSDSYRLRALIELDTLEALLNAKRKP